MVTGSAVGKAVGAAVGAVVDGGRVDPPDPDPTVSGGLVDPTLGACVASLAAPDSDSDGVNSTESVAPV